MPRRRMTGREAAEFLQQLVYWTPPSRTYTPRILCLAVDLRPQYGRFIMKLLPVAGDGFLMADAATLELAPIQELDPRAILEDFARRIEQDNPTTPGEPT